MTVRHHLWATTLLLSIVGTACTSSAQDWQHEHWTVTNFANVLSGGPDTGPVEQASGSVFALCEDQAGFLYLVSDQIIDIVTPQGIRHHLAGTGITGFRDGAAQQAEFRLGFNAYYGAKNIACSKSGTLFFSDSGNRRIRRVYQSGPEWKVDTWAGGGNIKLSSGQSAKPKTIRLRGTLAVASRPSGELIIADNFGAYRVASDGSEITFLGKWPDSASQKPGKPPQLHNMMGAADQKGNAYFVSRTPNVVVKVDAQNNISHFAGITGWDKKPHHLGDGPVRDVFFDTPNSIAMEADGSAIYICGGDEYDIRRVPTDGKTHTATLMQNGRWYKASVHPNRSRGPALYRPKITGRLKPDGKLTNLVASTLLGSDRHGNLYAKMNSWSGMTQEIEGKGLLNTRVFKLSRFP